MTRDMLHQLHSMFNIRIRMVGGTNLPQCTGDDCDICRVIYIETAEWTVKGEQPHDPFKILRQLKSTSLQMVGYIEQALGVFYPMLNEVGPDYDFETALETLSRVFPDQTRNEWVDALNAIEEGIARGIYSVTYEKS